jgi:uncharacterized membrane protein
MAEGGAPSRNALLVRLLLLAAVFCAVHLATIAGNVRLAVAIFILAIVVGPGVTSVRNLLRGKWLIAALAIILAVSAIIVLWPGGGTQAVLLAPPLLGYGATSLFFAHSLLPGEDPIITQMCRYSRGDPLPDGLEDYARRLTWGWVLLPAFLGFASLAAFFISGLEAWSWVTNVASPVLLVSFFVGEHVYRWIVHPHLGRPSLLHTCNVMFNTMSRRQ